MKYKKHSGQAEKLEHESVVFPGLLLVLSEWFVVLIVPA